MHLQTNTDTYIQMSHSHSNNASAESKHNIMSFQEKSDAFDEFTLVAKNNPATVFTAKDNNDVAYPLLVKFNCDYGGEVSKRVSVWRKHIRSTMRFHEESSHCNTCTENLNSLSLYAAKSGLVVFTNKQIGIFNGLPEANNTNKLLNKVVNLMKHHSSSQVPPFRLELCTDIGLRHGYAITNDGVEFEHHVGHTNSYMRYPLSKTQITMKAAFTGLSDIMFQFLDKLTNLANIGEVCGRCKVILKHLKQHHYGEKYTNAVNWIITTCEDYQVAGCPSLPWDRIEIVANMISRSHLGLNSDRKPISFHLQQANGAILNWLENAHTEKALHGLIRETLNPTNYQQKKPAPVSTWGSGGKGSSAGQIAKVQKLLGDFNVSFATVESMMRNRPSSTFVVPSGRFAEEKTGASNAFASLTLAATDAKKSNKNRSLAKWGSDPYSDFGKVTSLRELARKLKNIQDGHRLEIRYSADEPMAMYEFSNTHSDAWKLRSENEDDTTTGYSWSFLGYNSEYRTLNSNTWGGVHAIHFAGSTRSVFVMQDHPYTTYNTRFTFKKTYDKASIMRSEFNSSSSEKARRTGFGAWALSSIAHSFGQTVLSIMSQVTMEPLTNETPILGPGFCRSSKEGHEGEFQFGKDIQIRVTSHGRKIWPPTSEYHSIWRFDPSPNQATLPKSVAPPPSTGDWVEKLRQLKALYDEGVITSADFENKKASILASN